jgi:hypothetical protein
MQLDPIVNDYVIQEVFGKFAIEISGVISMYPDRLSAEAVISIHKNKARYDKLTQGYVSARGLQGKNAISKINIIKDFLVYQDTVEVCLVADDVYDGVVDDGPASPEPLSNDVMDLIKSEF